MSQNQLQGIGGQGQNSNNTSNLFKEGERGNSQFYVNIGQNLMKQNAVTPERNGKLSSVKVNRLNDLMQNEGNEQYHLNQRTLKAANLDSSNIVINLTKSHNASPLRGRNGSQQLYGKGQTTEELIEKAKSKMNLFTDQDIDEVPTKEDFRSDDELRSTSTLLQFNGPGVVETNPQVNSSFSVKQTMHKGRGLY